MLRREPAAQRMFRSPAFGTVRSVELQPLNPDRIRALSAALLRAGEVEELYTAEDPVWSGKPGSTAQHERLHQGTLGDRCWSPRIILTVYAGARLQLTAVADHLASMAKLLPERLDGTLTPIVISRAVVETSARAWWQLDSGISPDQRIARGLAEQLYSSYQAERLATGLGVGLDLLGAPDADHLARLIEELGLTVAGDTEQPMVGDQQRPRPTRLVAMFLRDTLYHQWASGVYPLYSAVGHGTHYGLMRAYRMEGEVLEGERVLHRVGDQREVDGAAGLGMAAFIAVLRRAVRLMGWGWIRVDAYEQGVRRLLTA